MIEITDRLLDGIVELELQRARAASNPDWVPSPKLSAQIRTRARHFLEATNIVLSNSKDRETS